MRRGGRSGEGGGKGGGAEFAELQEQVAEVWKRSSEMEVLAEVHDTTVHRLGAGGAPGDAPLPLLLL